MPWYNCSYYLENNEIHTEGGRYIANVVKRNRSLVTLNISNIIRIVDDNDINEKVIIDIKEALIKNTNKSA